MKPHLLVGRTAWRLECARLPSRCDILVFAALVSLKGCDPCVGQSVAFIIHSRTQYIDILYLPLGTECQGLSFVLPLVVPAPVGQASPHVLIVPMTSAKGRHYTPQWYGWKHLPLLLSYPTCVRTLTNSSCRAYCPDQLLYCSYWARCHVCLPVRYGPQVACPVPESFASLEIERKSAAVAKP